MGSSCRMKTVIDGKEDRIGDFANNLLTLILSLLPTSCAVATSVLLSRWKTLWKTLDSFDLDEYDHVTLSLGTKCKNYAKGFPGFAKSVMQQCDAINVSKFRLRYLGIENSVFLHDCVLFAISRNVKELELNILNGRGLKFPNEFFICKSLEKLKIEILSAFDVPLSSETFPNLKSLHILFVCPESEFCRKLLSCCPKLEDLVIHAGLRYWDHLQLEDSRPSSGCKTTVNTTPSVQFVLPPLSSFDTKMYM